MPLVALNAVVEMEGPHGAPGDPVDALLSSARRGRHNGRPRSSLVN